MNLANTLTTTPEQQEFKPAWQSKTIWTSVIFALVPLFPPVGAWVAANPAIASAVVSGIFAALRLVTKGKLTVN